MLDLSQTVAKPSPAALSSCECLKSLTSPSQTSRVKQPTLNTTRISAAAAVEAAAAPRFSSRPDRASANTIFVCDEESHFYSQCLERFLLEHQPGPQTTVEFGSGDGSPVVRCLSKANFEGVIHGFELCEKAVKLAREHTAQLNLDRQYQVHNADFFDGVLHRRADCLIANPPYIPAPDNNIHMPSLHGGIDGANLTRELMTLGYNSAVLMISSYSNPIKTLQFAQQQGYLITDYMIKSMPFGYYSSEPKVKEWLNKMKVEGQAYFAKNTYLLAGVLLQKKHTCSQRQLDGLTGLPQLAPKLHNGIMTWANKNAGIAASSDAHRSLDQSQELQQVLTALR